MIIIRFPEEQPSVGPLASWQPVSKSWASGEMMVPPGALPSLALEGIPFHVEGTGDL